MSKTNFEVQVNGDTWKCYLEDGVVWYIDRDGNPASAQTIGTRITSMDAAKQAAIDSLYAHMKYPPKS